MEKCRKVLFLHFKLPGWTLALEDVIQGRPPEVLTQYLTQQMRWALDAPNVADKEAVLPHRLEELTDGPSPGLQRHQERGSTPRVIPSEEALELLLRRVELFERRCPRYGSTPKGRAGRWVFELPRFLKGGVHEIEGLHRHPVLQQVIRGKARPVAFFVPGWQRQARSLDILDRV